MPDEPELHAPWMVAVWPGMGHVATTAGYYLMAKLGMRQIAEWASPELFDTQHVEVKQGLIRTGRLPRSRLFAWTDPNGRHDIVVFIGEAQPPTGNQAFCRELVGRAKELGIERVFTFAALASAMQPGQPSRVHGAATDAELVEELKRLEVEVLEEGHIGGLNGVLLGVAAESGFRGTCLLGEMPHLFTQLPYPRASLAVLQSFTTIAGIELDLDELRGQAEAVEKTLGDFMAKAQGAVQGEPGEEDDFGAEAEEDEEETPAEPVAPEPPPEEPLAPEDEERVETLFESARQDRSKAYELKRELDRLGVFKRYEDRFLDLFKSG